VAKAIGYTICLGCGFRGGPVFPAIFLGVGIACIAVQVFGVSVTWAVAVGTAAGMASGTGLVFSALVLAVLLVGREALDTVPAAVLAAAAAWTTRGAISGTLPGGSTSAEPAAPAASD
jgi:H+/Cl- antiporter ClcA